MPELPDVEVFKQYIDATSLHQKIIKVHVADPRILSGVSKRSFRRKLQGHKLEGTHRRGKYLFVDFNYKSLVLHFGMTGKLKYYKGDSPPDYAKVIWLFKNDYQLAYIAPRILGRLQISNSSSTFIEQHKLGSDALDISIDELYKTLCTSRSKIKSALMNQKILAGLGNIYSDEILFQSGIHPEIPANQLSRSRVKELFHKMQKVLQKAIEKKARPKDLPRNYLLPHREKGGECPRCNCSFDTIKVSGRTTCYCPNCQKK